MTKLLCCKAMVNLLGEEATQDKMIQDGVIWALAALVVGITTPAQVTTDPDSDDGPPSSPVNRGKSSAVIEEQLLATSAYAFLLLSLRQKMGGETNARATLQAILCLFRSRSPRTLRLRTWTLGNLLTWRHLIQHATKPG